MSDARPVVYVIGFSAPPVLYLHEFITLLRDDGWDPWVILSPTAASWTDVSRLGAVSGHAVRVEARKPSDRDPLPLAHAIVAAPLTFNSLNKWAAGISDTLALGLLNESLGLGIPVTAALCIKSELRHHPAYANSYRTLADVGVNVLQPATVVVRQAMSDPTIDWIAAMPRNMGTVTEPISPAVTSRREDRDN